jgi:cytochrome c-type biogenesis protein CcmF
MIHYFVGDLGHLFVIISFVASLASAFIYLKARKIDDPVKKNAWLVNGRIAFAMHGVAVLGVVASLFTIIYKHYFEYHYAFSHSSLHLPGEYMISCFWEGQEGSFLLWSNGNRGGRAGFSCIDDPWRRASADPGEDRKLTFRFAPRSDG